MTKELSFGSSKRTRRNESLRGGETSPARQILLSKRVIGITGCGGQRSRNHERKRGTRRKKGNKPRRFGAYQWANREVKKNEKNMKSERG